MTQHASHHAPLAPFRLMGRTWRKESTTLVCEADASGRRDSAVLLLDAEGLLKLDLREHYGRPTVPFEEYHRRTLTWTVLEGSAELDVSRLRSALGEGGALHDLMRRVAEGHEECWDGSNVVGRPTEDAELAPESLEASLAEGAFATEVHVMFAEDLYCEQINEKVRADSADVEVLDLAAQDEAQALKSGIRLINAHGVRPEHRDALQRRLLEHV